MLRYLVAYFLPRGDDRMVVAEVLDFPEVVSQGFDLADARLMIASALDDIARIYLDEGKALPLPAPDASSDNADLIELLPLSVAAGMAKLSSGTSCLIACTGMEADSSAKSPDPSG